MLDDTPGTIEIDEEAALRALDATEQSFREGVREIEEFLKRRPGTTSGANPWARAHLITRSEPQQSA
jgi:hypothetical protein